MLDCNFCFRLILDGDKIRTMSPATGSIHPQFHTYPNGVDINNRTVKGSCVSNHKSMEHIHEKCVPAWCDKFNMPTPEPFEPGDWNRLGREVK